MKKFWIIMAISCASLLISGFQSSLAEMKTLTDKQMEDKYINARSFFLKVAPATHSYFLDEEDKLLDRTEEDKLEDELQDRSANKLIGETKIQVGPIVDFYMNPWSTVERTEKGGEYISVPHEDRPVQFQFFDGPVR